MIDLRQEILDVLQAISIIIVFLTVFFGIKYPLIISMMKIEMPLDKPKNLEQVKNKLNLCFVTDCLPQIVLGFLSAIVTLPLASKIIKIEGLQIYKYDTLSFAYLIITLWVMALFVWIIYLSVKIIVKRIIHKKVI